ncbi:MAG: DUF1338 domain-containing protein [Kangiellaceae bacterium]|nr:DUF1338 domain-containing protein [Kangiellaceae bacterium]
MESTFESMWQDYLALNPQAQTIYDLFSRENNVVNDHVAFRTYGIDGIRVEDIAQPLLAAGYQEMESYQFEQKKLRAKHYQHPTMPLVFISELIIEEFSSELQSIVRQLVHQIQPAEVNATHFLYSGRPWELSSNIYNRLLEESEYAAWVAAFGYRPNHFTVSINHLDQFSTIQEVNLFLKENGFKLNTSGGEVKGSEVDFLEQSSTIANSTNVEFVDMTLSIPSCFYEFALRHPTSSGEIFKGFVASSADKIFESTDTRAA